jgi:hypothetical protein
MERKSISQGNAVFSKLIMQNPITSKKKKAEKFNKNPSLIDRGRFLAARIPTKSFLP